MKLALTLIFCAVFWQAGGQTPTSATPPAPNKKIVRNGGTSDPEITVAPSMSQQQADQETSEANRLLAAAEANLRIIAERPHEASRAEVMSEVKNYMNQARTALSAGDIERAHKLAVKADVLTDDMVKH